MSHYYHSPLSFFVENLQLLTNEGRIEWEAEEKHPEIILAELDDDIHIVMHTEGKWLGIMQEAEKVRVVLRRAEDIYDHEFDELLNSVEHYILLKENPVITKAINIVSYMVNTTNPTEKK
jgi:hypothetical protein